MTNDEMATQAADPNYQAAAVMTKGGGEGAVPLVDVAELARAVSEFQAALPGWWFSVCACSVSRDASCGPDRQGPDAALLRHDLFDSGFHADLREGTLAEALRTVMRQALDARFAHAIDSADGSALAARATP